MTEKTKVSLSYVALLVTSLIFGSSFFILKDALDTLPTFFVLAFRFSIGAVVLGAVFFKSLLRMRWKSLLHGVVLGGVLVAAYVLQTLGLLYTTPGKNAFLTATYVILVPFMMWLFYRNRPRWKNLLAALLCLTGIGLISLSGDLSIGIGDILTLCSGIFYSLQIVFTKRFTRDDEAGQLLFGEMLTAGVVFWIITFCLHEIPSSIEPPQWFPLLYLTFAATCAAQALQLLGQKHTSANTTSLLVSLEAPFGVMFSVIFYGERPTVQIYFGFAVVFVAVLVSEINWIDIIKKRKKPCPSAPPTHPADEPLEEEQKEEI